MEENTILIDFSNEAWKERYELITDRISDMPGCLSGSEADYFAVLRDLASLCCEVMKGRRGSRELNDLLFYDLTEDGYRSSFLDPNVCLEAFGETGKYLCAWYSEFRGIIPGSFEKRLPEVTVLLETTVQLFNLFESRAAGELSDAELKEEITETVYSYVYDYAEEYVGNYIRCESEPGESFALDIVMNAELSDTGEDSYLYSFGEFITEEELETARLMASLSEETVDRMAAVYTDGYIKGFELTGKDIGIKSTVSCFLPLGFERFMRAAVRRFNAAGLEVIINRGPVHLINRRFAGNIRPGFFGSINAEYEHDHKEDMALFWGDKLKSRKLQALKNAYEKNAAALKRMSGRACVEVFGKKGSEPSAGSARPVFSEYQKSVIKEYTFRAHELAQSYMPDDETSFTIIAWPSPSIAKTPGITRSAEELRERYRELFERFIEINTVPADKWQIIQQQLIDALDRAEYVEVKGSGRNETRLRIMLHRLQDPKQETNFENCLADVNIPAGEVFTSPRLSGTDGMLHAGYVYIGGILFRDLRISFSDGRVSGYSCGGYEDPEDGKKLIENVIFRNRSGLPMGEFAIGTNTAAFAAAKRYDIADRLPVLIAEKTGPHFAVGDTCYSYEEELVTYNPDGKRITARENECSALRNTDPQKAYFSVHTDITIPYEELEYIRAVGPDGITDIIRSGRFVLPGTEELNDAFDE